VLTSNSSAFALIFQNPERLYTGKQCEISWGNNNGYATLDEYGSIAVKFRASVHEEHKHIVFMKIPKTFQKNNDAASLLPILKSLYVRKERVKRAYIPKLNPLIKKERKAGAERKVRNAELENFVVASLGSGVERGHYPNRRASFYYAKKWVIDTSTSSCENFRVSKGWCDKFMKRNNVQLKKWEAALDKKQKFAKQLKSAMAEEKTQVTQQN
jgi:hypothetical protein